MVLSDLLTYNYIVVQCHNDPDADALASGYAVYCYLMSKGKNVDLVYGGKNEIKKSNLVNMVEDLEIPINHVHEAANCDLLLTVDCQYGQGNVEKFQAPKIAVIDHHMVSGELPELSEVRSNLGSCSTLIWSMLKEEGFDPNQNSKLSTALYYGLYMDTGGMAEVNHPMDFDLREQAAVDPQLMSHFLNSNLSIEELEIAGTALLRMDMMEEYRCALVKANQCDPNILGIISDLVLQVDTVDVCIVFCLQSNGVKYSVRSCIREVLADELAIYIADGIGTGGGHKQKAGGFLQFERLVPRYKEYCNDLKIKPRLIPATEDHEESPSASGCKAFMESILRDYFENCTIIEAKNFNRKLLPFEKFARRKIAYGYVDASKLYPIGTSLTVRSVSGDIPVTVQDNMYFLVGGKGDFYATSKQVFEKSYRTTDWEYLFSKVEYIPTIHSAGGKQISSLAGVLKVCIPCDDTVVSAVKLTNNIKLFDLWDDKSYHYGKMGDYLVLRGDSEEDMAITPRAIFEDRFKPVGEKKIKGIVFDLDGTLLDTLQDLTSATNAAMAQIGAPERTLREVKSFVGNGIGLLLERATPFGKDNPRFDEVKDRFIEYYKEHATDETRPYAGIPELLQELKGEGLKMAIVSNKVDAGVQDLKNYYFPDYITVAVGEKENVRRKPAPDLALRALDVMGIAPEDALYVGDSDVDIETAKNAGMRCISVAWGFRETHFLQEHGATDIINTPLELLKYI